jgi:hypothetical protein
LQIPLEAAIGSITITKLTEGYIVVTSCRDIEKPQEVDTVAAARATRADVESDLDGFLSRADRVSAVQHGKLILFPKRPGGLPGVDA